MKSSAVSIACARPSGSSWVMNSILAPKREPSPVATRISSPVCGETMIPISVTPASTSASIP